LESTNGEVSGYQWQFRPVHVKLSDGIVPVSLGQFADRLFRAEFELA
jgi:hypothetical protein